MNTKGSGCASRLIVAIKEKQSLPVIPSDSDVPTSKGSLFSQIGEKAEKSLDACLTRALRDGGNSRAGLKEPRGRGAVGGVML